MIETERCSSRACTIVGVVVDDDDDDDAADDDNDDDDNEEAVRPDAFELLPAGSGSQLSLVPEPGARAMSRGQTSTLRR